MGSGNWIVDNLNSALATWNEKLTEIWTLISTSPEEFKGGGIWDVILNIHDALRAIGYALLVLFFVAGVVKTCGSFTELKRPEVAVKTFVRFALAQGAVTYGLELMMALFSIAQGAVSTIMDASGLTAMSDTALPDEMVTIIEDVGFLESIPLWAVTLLGSLFIWVLSLVMILTVYSRFFKLYMATAIAPIPLASFAGQPSSSIGVAFVKSYAAICLEGCMIVLACIIFSQFAAAPPAIADDTMAAATIVWNYIGELIFNMLVLVGAIMALICMKHSDRKSSKFLSNGMAFTYSSVILLLIGAVMERPSAIIGHAVLVFFLIWLAVEAVFLLIQNALVCRGAYLHGAGKVSAGLGAVGGMLGIASARVIGLLFSRGTILSVVILGFSALLGMVGTQYFLKIYYLKRFSLPDHI